MRERAFQPAKKMQARAGQDRAVRSTDKIGQRKKPKEPERNQNCKKPFFQPFDTRGRGPALSNESRYFSNLTTHREGKGNSDKGKKGKLLSFFPLLSGFLLTRNETF